MQKEKDVQTEAAEVTQQVSGIFPEQQPALEFKVKTGTQKAIELVVGAVIVLLAIIIISLVRSSYMRPISTYYKGLSAMNEKKMCQAFPSWLRNANVDDDTITIEGMCLTMISSVVTSCGNDYKVSADMVSFADKDEAYLQKLETGIESEYGKNVNISKGRWVKLNVVYEYGEFKQEMTEYARVYKINGRWVLLDIPGAEA